MGLVTAYKTAAQEALNQTQVVEQQIVVKLVFDFTYEITPVIMKLVKDFELRVVNQEFGDACAITVEALLSVKDNLLERIRLLNLTGSVFTTTLSE